jgi:hypothetical protein
MLDKSLLTLLSNSYRYCAIPIGQTNILNMSFTDNDTSINISGLYIGFAESISPTGSPTNFRWCISNGTVQNNKTNTATSNTTIKCGYVFIYPYTQAALNTLFNRFNIQVELGLNATSYEQYCGGTPSPNPNYPQSLVPVNGNLNVTGANGESATAPISGGGIGTYKTIRQKIWGATAQQLYPQLNLSVEKQNQYVVIDYIPTAKKIFDGTEIWHKNADAGDYKSFYIVKQGLI